VVDRIDDVVESSVDAYRRTECDALFGSAIIQGRVTDLLDLPTLIHRAVPAFFDDSTLAEGGVA
jgi:two-component system chemotaxis sensor kinase CheA